MTADANHLLIRQLGELEYVASGKLTDSMPKEAREAICEAIENLRQAQRILADPMYPYAVDHLAGQLYKADADGNYHPLPKP